MLKSSPSSLCWSDLRRVLDQKLRRRCECVSRAWRISRMRDVRAYHFHRAALREIRSHLISVSPHHNARTPDSRMHVKVSPSNGLQLRHVLLDGVSRQRQF